MSRNAATHIRHHVEREDHLLLVAEVVEAEELEALRRRPAETDLFDVRRSGPVHPRRQADDARRAPIGLPAVHELDVESGRYPIQLADRCDRGQEAGLDGLCPRPGTLLGAARPVPSQTTRTAARANARPRRSFISKLARSSEGHIRAVVAVTCKCDHVEALPSPARHAGALLCVLADWPRL